VTIMLIGGIVLIAFGLGELAWVSRTGASRALAAQGMMFAELGLLFIALVAMPGGPARIGVIVVLGIAGALSMAMQIKLIRRERSTDTVQR